MAKARERLNKADDYFDSIENTQTPHHPRAYGLVAKNVNKGRGDEKEYIEYAKKMLKFDSTRNPKYLDHLTSSVASYGTGGAALGALVGGKKGALVGSGLGGLVAGPIARGIALNSEKRSVSDGKKALKDKKLDDLLSKIYKNTRNK